MERPLHCLGCQHENGAGGRFCEHCGAPLPKVCPVCNKVAGINARYCSECGRALGSEKALRVTTSSLILEGERKHVTVLFADVVDSTEIVEAAGDPEVCRGSER
jgi:predicted amidophosphoribosyltransferase